MPDPANIGFLDHGLCIALVPKTGTLSIKKAVFEWLGVNYHHAYIGQQYATPFGRVSWLENSQVPSDWLTIAAVRHPEDRLLSGYANKVRDRYIRSLQTEHGIYRGMPFKDVWEIIKATEPSALNQHFRHQALILEGLNVGVLMRTETLTSSWEQARDRVSEWCGLWLPDIRHLHKTRSPKPALTAKQRLEVEEYFADDYESYGYDRRSVCGGQEVRANLHRA